MKDLNPERLTGGAASEKSARPAKKRRNTEWKAILPTTSTSQRQQAESAGICDFYIKVSKLRPLIRRAIWLPTHGLVLFT